MKQFKSISQIKQYHQQKGFHFFEAAALRFFDSKILSKVYKGSIFITSEQYHDSRGNSDPRMYSARIILEDGTIETLPKFQAFESKREAEKYIETLPLQIAEALEFMKNCFNSGNNQKFIDQALIEPENSKDGSYTVDSFTGSCTWLCEHAEEMDDYVLKNIAEHYRKQKKTAVA